MKTTTIYLKALLCFAVLFSSLSVQATIHFMKFSVEQKEEAAFLDWISMDEDQVESFSIEKSLDGKFWFEISTVIAKRDSSVYYHNSYVDSNLADGIQYYRVKLSTVNGKNEFSDVNSFKLEKEVYLIPELFPNPSNGVFVLKYSFKNEDKASFNIVTSRGKIVDLEPINTNGLYTFDISNFYPGIYFIQIIEGDKVTRVKLVKK